MDTKETTPWIQTHSGKAFHYHEDWRKIIPQIDISDICHALGRIQRFLGHTNFPITVLQHSLAVAACVPQELRLEALLHDAAEAYTGDIPTPLKKFLGFDFEIRERAIELAIRKSFNLPFELNPIVSVYDEAILFYEKGLAFSHDLNWGWSSNLKIDPGKVYQYYTSSWSPLYLENEIRKCL